MTQIKNIEHLQFRRGTKEQLLRINPVLLPGELVYCTDDPQIKIGNGTSAYTALRPILPRENTTGLDEPPNTGKAYARYNRAWVDPDPSLWIPEAPKDGQEYTWNGSQWITG